MLYVAHGVLEALTYAHAQTDAAGVSLGLVHRDISPSNIMLTAMGEVKLFDFGIVKATGRVSKTEAGVVKGNIAFMSPEQARGQPLDQRSDLFSLGLVLYYSLINEQTYRATGTFEQLMQAATGPSEEQLASWRPPRPQPECSAVRSPSISPSATRAPPSSPPTSPPPRWRTRPRPPRSCDSSSATSSSHHGLGPPSRSK